jgi:hypothetical protein
MKSLLRKSFGGLPVPYYLRHFLFGLMFPVFMYFTLRDNLYPPSLGLYVVVGANTLLYPYARFVYEGFVGFVLGESVFYVNSGVLIFAKFLTMFACWLFAPYIAQVALVYLYAQNPSKPSDESSVDA